MAIKERYNNIISKLRSLEFLPLLSFRLILAYGFYQPAKMKWQDIHAIGDWMKSLGIPAPYFSAYLVAVTEVLGIVLLIMGLATRLIAIPLIVILLVAIGTTHWANGFSATKGGFEIPLYYLLMLFALLIFGAGKISLDRLTHTKNEGGVGLYTDEVHGVD